MIKTPRLFRRRDALSAILACLCAVSFAPGSPSARAAEPSYAWVKELPYVTRLLADPSRPRVYGTLTSSNSIIVIDTTSLTAQTIPTGLAPIGLALSRDNSRLYVANSGSTSAAIGVVDLE